MIDTLSRAWLLYHLLRGDTLDELREHWVIRLGMWLVENV